MNDTLVVHGLNLSYFTGKLEAYFRAKGIDYQMAEMDTRGFAALGRITGVRQMPQVECPDGSWLTDTTLILDHVERFGIEPVLTPQDPATAFVARLIEDMADETLWRPALYYRWAFRDDARLNSGRLARGMLRDVPLPFALRRQLILRRQRRHFLTRDGVTGKTAPAIEALYLEALAAMELALAHAPYVLGGRPTAADFGLFGPFFRHFFCDPTPARLMRDRAPRTLQWVTRLWGADPAQLCAAPLPDHVPDSAAGLLRLVADHHLPYLAANADAVAEGRARVRFEDGGATFTIPASPYRAWCLDRLRLGIAALGPLARARVDDLLGPAASLLRQPRQSCGAFEPPVLPIAPGARPRAVDRAWRPA